MSVPERMAHTLSEAAVSITITSVTDVVSFFIGIISPFQSVRIFCIYSGEARRGEARAERAQRGNSIYIILFVGVYLKLGPISRVCAKESDQVGRIIFHLVYSNGT